MKASTITLISSSAAASRLTPIRSMRSVVGVSR
jgi:hypothetical protein